MFDPYICNDISVLINKLDIKNEEILDIIEWE